MKVLCVNHTGTVSGAERSLLDLLGGLPSDIEARLACPSEGQLAQAARTAGIGIDAIPGTDGSLRLHPLRTPIAIGTLSLAGLRTAAHARRMNADVIHANSIRAGLISVPAGRLVGLPVVVHVRDRLPRSAAADASLRMIALGAQTVVANSRYTADGLRAVTAHGHVRVVYNPVDPGRFVGSELDRDAIRATLGLSRDAVVLAVIGQITPWKAQDDAVRATGLLRRAGVDARLLIVGEPKFVSSATRYDNLGYYADLQRLISSEALGDRVHLLGERSDIPALMAALDVLLVPSWEEPFGRVVIEAMAARLPVLATSVGGPAEIITDGIDGMLLAPHDPGRWADTIVRLAASPELRERLGEAGRKRANDFALVNHVAAMREIYDQAIRSRSR